jgi:hypothetical protein
VRRKGAAAARWAGATLLAALVAACNPEIPTDPPPAGVSFLELSGQWVYSASELRRAGSPGDAPCEVTGTILELRQIEGAGAFTGTSSGGVLTCPGELSMLSGPLIPYRIGEGYTFNQFVSFDFGSPDWRHDGLVVSKDSVTVDSMSGEFTIRNAGVVFEGRFRAVRRGGS